MVVGPCRGLALLLLHGPGLRGAGTKNSPAALSLPWSLQLGTASGPGPGVTLARLLEALLGDGVRLGGLWLLLLRHLADPPQSQPWCGLTCPSPGTGWLLRVGKAGPGRCRLDGKPEETHRAASPREGVGAFVRSQAL